MKKCKRVLLGPVLERRSIAGLQHEEDQARIVGRDNDLALVGLETQI